MSNLSRRANANTNLETLLEQQPAVRLSIYLKINNLLEIAKRDQMNQHKSVGVLGPNECWGYFLV